MNDHQQRWTKKLEDYNKEDEEEEVSDEEYKRNMNQDEDNEEMIMNVVQSA